MKLAAFLKHPKLRRIILPASSGPTYEPDEMRVWNYVILDTGDRRVASSPQMKWKDANRTNMVEVKDAVLNAALLRQTRKSQMASLLVKYFTVGPPTGRSSAAITSSEFSDAVGVYGVLEERAYKTKSHHKEQGWAWRGNDELIELCETLNTKSELSPVEMMSSFSADVEKLVHENKTLKYERDEAVDRSESLQSQVDHGQERRTNLYNELQEEKEAREALIGELINAKYSENHLRGELQYVEEDLRLALARVEKLKRRLDNARAVSEDPDYFLGESSELRE